MSQQKSSATVIIDMMTIGITGGTGFIGGHLAKLLVSKGYNVIIFSRDPSRYASTTSIQYALWNPGKQQADINALKKINAIVHLAGEGIADKRWTAKRKKEIVDSRVEGTNFLVQQLNKYAPGCQTFISASAIGYYGPDRDGKAFIEDSPPYNDFLATTCIKWEQASEPVAAIMRRVVFRFGIILGNEGGAFPKFVDPERFGIKPLLGGGKQVISWIHVEDLAKMILYAIEHEKIRGTYNAVAPVPVSQALLMHTIGYNIGGIKISVPVPAIFLKLLLGEMGTEVLKSTTVCSSKIQEAGFSFKYPTIAAAVGNLVK